MKIKRFTGTDMRQVLRQVREEQGPDAVILSNQRIEGGIEVITAVDYDEALIQQALGTQPSVVEAAPRPAAAAQAPRSAAQAPERPAPIASVAPAAGVAPAARAAAAAREEVAEDDVQAPELDSLRSEIRSLRGLVETQLSGLVWRNGTRRSPLRAQVLRNLARIGIAADVAMKVVGRLEPMDGIRHIWRTPLAELGRMIPVVGSRIVEEGGIAALIGPTGVGKTTTVAKLAAQYALRHGSENIALVCADAYRIGAREHLTAFANIIGVRVHAVSRTEELAATLAGLRSKKLVLIDTEGVSQRDTRLADRLAGLRDAGMPVEFYLTLSAASQEAGLDETIRQFSGVPLAGAVITKIDEAGQLGCVIGTMIRRNLAAAWFSDGQRIPDDLHPAECRKLWLVNQAIECMEASEPRIDERFMAENYAQASVANA